MGWRGNPQVGVFGGGGGGSGDCLRLGMNPGDDPAHLSIILPPEYREKTGSLIAKSFKTPGFVTSR